MARLSRVCPLGVPQHVIQRGNNRQICFASDQDFSVYANWLAEYAEEFGVEIHAWVFMTNHTHLLVTPRKEAAISLMMQALGRRYVPYFNREYRRTGTLWEGRFKACLVQSEYYLLQCQRYIELNPLKAGMVDDPANYAWSSYQCNALGKESKLYTAHAEYLALAQTKMKRLSAYRSLFDACVDVKLQRDMQMAVNKGLALGSDKFKDEIETLCGRRLRKANMGRPRKIKH
jgi:putative transposase